MFTGLSICYRAFLGGRSGWHARRLRTGRSRCDASPNREARQRALDAMAPPDGEPLAFDPSPRDLQEYLRDKLNEEYELCHFLLDPRRFDPTMVAEAGYQPKQLSGRDRTGAKILDSLLRIDFLHAQRHFSDLPGSARAENLSRVLSRFYDRNLEQRGEDLATLRALAKSEVLLNEHLERVFAPTLLSLAHLGYPGLANPRLMIRSALDPESIMSSRDGARVHYALGSDDGAAEPPTLPDNYNGLGFKNLIFMVVELLDIHAQWLGIEDNRPPVHLTSSRSRKHISTPNFSRRSSARSWISLRSARKIKATIPARSLSRPTRRTSSTNVGSGPSAISGAAVPTRRRRPISSTCRYSMTRRIRTFGPFSNAIKTDALRPVLRRRDGAG